MGRAAQLDDHTSVESATLDRIVARAAEAGWAVEGTDELAQAVRERAARRAREEREAAELEAREARLLAVERNHRRGRVSRRPRSLRGRGLRR